MPGEENTTMSTTTTDKPPHAAARLEQLPTELVLQTLKQLPDLASLDSAIRASAQSYRVFDNYAVEITQAVLEQAAASAPAPAAYLIPGYTCNHIRVLIAIIALIRSSQLSDTIKNLEDFEQRVVYEALAYDSRTRPSATGFAPQRLRDDTAPAVLRSILATARRLTWIAQECLEAFYESGWQDKSSWCRRSSSEGPTWQEEQRIMRVLWRLQLILDLQAAASAGLLAGWPAAHVDVVKRGLNPREVYGPLKHVQFFAHDAGSEASWMWVLRPPPEHMEMCSVLDYLECKFGAFKRKDDATRWWPPAAALRGVEVSRRWDVPAPRLGDNMLIALPAQWDMPLFMWLRSYGPEN